MGARDEGISTEIGDWLVAQPVFFVSTAPLDVDSHVNCSPKGNRGEFAILGPMTVAYLDQSGSGIETIAHLRENGRITIMFCAFTGAPRIVRLQGRGEFMLREDTRFATIAQHFAADVGDGARAVIVAHLDRVADSCGFGVPLMQFSAHRPALDAWSKKKGMEGVIEYQQKNNLTSIDNLPGLDALDETSTR
jgi:hypothetical protein